MSYALKLACAALVGAAALPLSEPAMAADLAAPEAFVVETMSPIDVSFGVKGSSENGRSSFNAQDHLHQHAFDVGYTSLQFCR